MLDANLKITPEFLDELEALEQAATPGRWKLDKPGKAPHSIVAHEKGWEKLVMNISWLAEAEKNGPFLLASRNALPALIQEVRRLWQVRDCLAEKLESYEEYCCICPHFRPDYSTPESAGDTCSLYLKCSHSWVEWAEQQTKEEV